MNLLTLKKLSKTFGIIAVLIVALAATIFGGYKVAGNLAKASSCSAQKVANAQVTSNSAVIAWETTDVSQGRVEYGTNAANLAFTAPEATSGKIHNVPLTLLTPNTVYYYVIAIADARCDSTGQTCSGNCIPWSFTTTPLAPQITPSIVPSPLPTNTPQASGPTPSVVTPTSIKTTVSATGSAIPTTSAVQPTAGLSKFCENVKTNIGESNKVPGWDAIKQYDIDGNGVINGIDVIKCQASGK